MRYLAVATDYDGVMAQNGSPSEAAVAAIKRLKASGRRAILVTGRRLDDIREHFPQYGIFDFVVLENGAVVYSPSTGRETVLADRPPERFVKRLKELGVAPLELGRVVISTWVPHHTAVLQAIRETGLELHIVFNRDAVMVLPACVNKSTGLEHALRKLGLSRHEVLGIGDSQNDHSFLDICECSATVANAVPSIRDVAAIVAKKENGEGLAELIDQLIADDLHSVKPRYSRYMLALGERLDGTILETPTFGLNILVAGPSGAGKSTVAAGIVERLIRHTYQLCIIDPEGDYGTVQDVITIGNQNHAVTVGEVLALLEDPKITLNVNLLGIPLADRPEFFGQLYPSLQAIRTRTGRPHWIVLDEAHHMLPAEWAHLGHALPQRIGETMLVTVHPDHLSPQVLKIVDVVIAVGDGPDQTIGKFAKAIGREIEWPKGLTNTRGQACVWFTRNSDPPIPIKIIPGAAERIRHHRKYAEGNMRERSFYFRGPDNRHNLRAQNLTIFAQISDGIDEETWMFHLRNGDYSRWFRNSVKDRYLADQAERIEKRQDLSPCDARRLIRSLIEARYTLPE